MVFSKPEQPETPLLVKNMLNPTPFLVKNDARQKFKPTVYSDDSESDESKPTHSSDSEEGSADEQSVIDESDGDESDIDESDDQECEIDEDVGQEASGTPLRISTPPQQTELCNLNETSGSEGATTSQPAVGAPKLKFELSEVLRPRNQNEIYNYDALTTFVSNEFGVSMILNWAILNPEKVKELSHSPPYLREPYRPPEHNKLMPGRYHTVVPNTLVFADDSFQPWCAVIRNSEGKKKRIKTRHQTTKNVKVNGKFYTVRNSTAKHPTNWHLKKQMIRIVDHELLSDVRFILYIYGTRNMIFPPEIKRRVDKHLAHDMKVLLRNRTLLFAMRELGKQKLGGVDRKQMSRFGRGVPSYVKTKKGPKPCTDPAALSLLSGLHADLFITSGSVNESKEPHSRDMKWRQEVMYVDREAVAVLLKQAPTEKELLRHHEKIDKMRDIKRKDQVQWISHVMSKSTPSVTLPGMTALVAADTTFSLSDMFLTLVICMLDNFRTKSSGKLRPLIIGWVLHPTMKMKHADTFGKLLSEVMMAVDSTKRITAFITDGDQGLKKLFQGPMFSMAQYLRCDVHRRDNVRLSAKHLPPENCQYLEEKLFGKEYKSRSGSDVFVGGAFSCLHRDDFNTHIQKIKTRCQDKTIADWLDSRSDKLYLNNSAYAKFRAGICAQWVTNNSIECINGQIKQIFQRSEGAHTIAAELLKLMKNDKLELLKAYLNDSATVKMAPHIDAKSVSIWHQTIRIAKEQDLSDLGLPIHYAQRDTPLPNWLTRSEHKMVENINKFDVFRVANTNCFVVHKPGLWRKGVNVDGSATRLQCGEWHCSERTNKDYVPCVHVASCIASLHETQAKGYWAEFEHSFDTRPQREIYREQRDRTAGDKKHNRKGGKGSKHNKDRRFSGGVCLSAEEEDDENADGRRSLDPDDMDAVFKKKRRESHDGNVLDPTPYHNPSQDIGNDGESSTEENAREYYDNGRKAKLSKKTAKPTERKRPAKKPESAAVPPKRGTRKRLPPPAEAQRRTPLPRKRLPPPAEVAQKPRGTAKKPAQQQLDDHHSPPKRLREENNNNVSHADSIGDLDPYLNTSNENNNDSSVVADDSTSSAHSQPSANDSSVVIIKEEKVITLEESYDQILLAGMGVQLSGEATEERYDAPPKPTAAPRVTTRSARVSMPPKGYNPDDGNWERRSVTPIRHRDPTPNNNYF